MQLDYYGLIWINPGAKKTKKKKTKKTKKTKKKQKKTKIPRLVWSLE